MDAATPRTDMEQLHEAWAKFVEKIRVMFDAVIRVCRDAIDAFRTLSERWRRRTMAFPDHVIKAPDAVVHDPLWRRQPGWDRRANFALPVASHQLVVRGIWGNRRPRSWCCTQTGRRAQSMG